MKIIPFIFMLFAFLGCEKMVLVHEGNTEKKPITFKLGHTQCPQCHMETLTLTNTAQAVMENGKTYIFDDVGCLSLWMNEHHLKKEQLTLWVYTHDHNTYIDASTAYYQLGDETPMGYGFGAYEKETNNTISFNEMYLKMLRGENLTNPKIRKKFNR